MHPNKKEHSSSASVTSTVADHLDEKKAQNESADIDHPSIGLEPGVAPSVHPHLAPVTPVQFSNELSRQLTLKGVVSREKDVEKGTEYNVVSWEEGDPENPRNWSQARKFWTLAVVSNLCFGVAFGSAIITGDLGGMAAHFHVSSEVINLTVALFVVGFGVGPIIYAPVSESIGRKPVYLLSYLLYFLFTLPSALAQNIGTLIVSRALAGLFASAPMTNVGGTVADMFSLETRGWPMTIFSSVIFVGPVFGPLIGGYLYPAALPSRSLWLRPLPVARL
ncbi:MFS general substrate transporter [Atractiella rhizophila]|nr:MFS general substrate transporter [Atractiella rhizophila]